MPHTAPKKAESPLSHAREVLATEIAALQALSDGLTHAFNEAVEIIAAREGRVVVTGIGKSGHVARKIAATLASTGTPALFVHPAEASHGDLGMVSKNDCILALSNSGEAAELSDIIAFSRRFSLPLMAMTSRDDSALGREADIILQIPKATEACPMGLAPTSSTTMMMALGDALAIALLKRNNFRETDYKVLHPGGKLGKRLQMVRDLMHTGDAVPTAPAGTPVSDIILIMTQKTFGCCAIVDEENTLLGIITDGDLRRHMREDLLRLKAETIMTKNPKTTNSQSLAAEALGRMNEKKVTSLFVVNDDGRVEGIIRMHDVLKAGVV